MKLPNQFFFFAKLKLNQSYRGYFVYLTVLNWVDPLLGRKICRKYLECREKSRQSTRKMNLPAQISFLHSKFESRVHKYIKIGQGNSRFWFTIPIKLKIILIIARCLVNKTNGKFYYTNFIAAMLYLFRHKQLTFR